MRFLFQLRWSGRDLRRHWIQVTVIAAIIGVGTGLYAGLGSTEGWRRESNDASYRLLNMYDVRVSLTQGSFVRRERLAGALDDLPHGGWIEETEERLIAPMQVDASTPREAILVPGRVVGMDVQGGGPHINAIDVTGGRSLVAADSGKTVGVLEEHFADHYSLPSTGTLRLGGGETLRYVGTGFSPEYFLVTNEAGGFLAEANFAVAFVSVRTAGRLAGHPGHVNDLVLTATPGADLQVLRGEIEDALADRFPDVETNVSGRRADDVYRILYDDIESDQRFWNVIAFLVLAGAAFAAFNLTSRMVEAQRREVGVGMALGVPPGSLAVRPLLVGAEIALLGVAFGVGLGILAGKGIAALMQDVFPLPVWRTGFDVGVFAEAAVVGFVLPFLATAWPVWRAVRVPPIEAIRTGHLAVRGGGLAPLARRLRPSGSTLGRMPFRNVLRAPRRSALTALGIGAAITVLIATLGMLDSFTSTIFRGEDTILGTTPDRLVVDLDGFYPVTAPEVADVASAEGVAEVEGVLRVPGTLARGGERFEASIEFLDLDSLLWRPTGAWREPASGAPGIVLAEKAAEDLSVAPGDLLSVEHPVRRGRIAFRMKWTEMEVIGTHALPLRQFAFMSMEDAGITGMYGAVNVVNVRPVWRADEAAIERAMFRLDGVASVQGVGDTGEIFREAVAQFVDILRFVQLFVLALALLIAVNASRIGLDERARDNATMFAYGVPVRSVVRINTVEGLMVGLLGTAVGVGIGMVVLTWVVESLMGETMPEFGIATYVAPGSVLVGLVLGCLAVALAPLLTVRRLRRMDIPSTLRVME